MTGGTIESVSRRAGIRRALSPRRLGRGTDDADLHDESARRARRARIGRARCIMVCPRVAADTDGKAPRFMMRPLPGARRRRRRRCNDGCAVSSRCATPKAPSAASTSAVRGGVPAREVADMLFAAGTDHRYLTDGHVLDFTNKAFEALDHAGWELADRCSPAWRAATPTADRMEESNAWRNPIDLVAILDHAFEAIAGGSRQAQSHRGLRSRRGALADLILLATIPRAIADAMLAALREGASRSELAGAVAYAAALRIARFPTSNEFGDWDTAHHSFTFANAVHQALRRAPSAELIARGLRRRDERLSRSVSECSGRADATSTTAQRRPCARTYRAASDRCSTAAAGQPGGATGRRIPRARRRGRRRCIAAIGHALLREDRDFHTIQDLEAAVRQYVALPARGRR